MQKWLFNNLSRHVDAWVGEWNKTSPERRRLRYRRIDRLLRRAGERLVIFLLFILALALGLSILAGTGWQHVWIPSGWVTADADILSYFGTLWTVQTTIAALVYPIVIAFVAVLLRRRATAGLGLRIYMLDAAVLPAGSSAIALVTWMGLQYLALPFLTVLSIAALMIGNSAWFVLNSAMTAWFLYRTLRFLNDDERLATFERFAVHVALPRDVRSRLMGLILQNAQKHGFVPGPDYLSDRPGPKILLYPMGEGAPCVSITLNRQRQVADVRLRLLAWAAVLWRRQAMRQDPGASFAGLGPDHPTLIFPIVPGDVFDGEIVVMRVRNGPPPGFLARLLIRRAVVLKAPPVRDASYSTFEILEEVATEALELAEQHRHEAAYQLVINLADLHASLLRAGGFQNENGESDNAALLQDPYGFGSRRIHERWLDVYRQLAEAAVVNIPLSPMLFERHAHLANRLIHRAPGERIEIIEHLLRLSTYLMFRLGLWWANKLEERGLIAHDTVTGAELPLPFGRMYESALQSFVGGWESLALTERLPQTDDAEVTWKAYSRPVRLAVAQADHTVAMLLAAVARGDRAAALWLADSFLKWWDKHRYAFSQSPLYAVRNPLMTLADLDQPWSSVRASLEAVPVGLEEASMAADLAPILARRYWSDLRLVAILILLDWSPPDCGEEALVLEIVTALIQGQSLKSGGEADGQPLTNARHVLFQLGRVELADEQYTSRLDKQVERAQGLRKPAMVAGRGYSSSGADDVQSLAIAKVQFLSTITSAPVDTAALESLQQRWADDLLRLERFERLHRNLAECITNSTYQAKRGIASVLRQRLGAPDDIAEAEAWLSTGLLGLAANTVQQRHETLRDAHVSQARLDKLGQEISDWVLGPDNDIFPFSLRPELGSELSGGSPHSLTVTGISKAPYTDPPLEEHSDLAASLDARVAEVIARGLVSDYVAAKELSELRTDSIAIFLEDIEAQAQSLSSRGLSPILILPTRNVPECAQPWRYQVSDGAGIDGDSPSTAVRTRRVDDAPSLVGYFHEVPAYQVPTKATCYVAPREDFKCLRYLTYGGSSCIRTSAMPDGDHRLKLRFEWVFEVGRG